MLDIGRLAGDKGLPLAEGAVWSVLVRQRLPHKMLAWCCFWLMLGALLPQQSWRLPAGPIGAPGIAAARPDRDQLLRPDPAKITLRTDLRDAAGSGDAGRKAIVAARKHWADFAAPSLVLAPAVVSGTAGFLARSTRHPRAPPA